MDKLAPYNKAIAAILTPVIVSLLLGLAQQYELGISSELAGQIAALIVAAITGAAVYAVPNKPKGE